MKNTLPLFLLLILCGCATAPFAAVVNFEADQTAPITDSLTDDALQVEINVPSYHLHFISDDRSIGGHILDFSATNGTLQLDTCNRFYMVLTDREEFAAADLSQDRSHELEKVEK